MNNKSMRKALLFFLFFFLSFSSLLGLFTINVNASVADDKRITWEWLSIDFKTDSTDDKVKFNLGGYSLSDFENLGIYQQRPDDSEIVYQSKATFQLDIQAYQGNDIFDAWSGLDVTGIKKIKYFYITIFNPWGWVESDTKYYVEAPNVVLGGTFDNCERSVNTEMEIAINPTFEDFSGLYLNGIKIESNEYLWDVKSAKVIDIKEGECGDYQDKYTDQTVSEAKVNLEQFTETSITNGDACAYVNSANLGVQAGESQTSDLQNSLVETNTVGYVQTNKASGKLVFKDFFKMRPRISQTKQYFTVREGGMEYDKFWGWDEFATLATHNENRIKSVHLYNRYVVKRYEINVYFLSTIKLDAEKYESYLNDPYLRMGDWIWDNELGGTTEVTPIYNEPMLEQASGLFSHLMGTLLGDWWWVIVLVVLIVVAYIAYKIFQMRKMSSIMKINEITGTMKYKPPSQKYQKMNMLNNLFSKKPDQPQPQQPQSDQPNQN